MKFLNTRKKVKFKKYLTKLNDEIFELDNEAEGEIVSFIFDDNNDCFITSVVENNNKSYFAILKPEFIIDPN